MHMVFLGNMLGKPCVFLGVLAWKSKSFKTPTFHGRFDSLISEDRTFGESHREGGEGAI